MEEIVGIGTMMSGFEMAGAWVLPLFGTVLLGLLAWMPRRVRGTSLRECIREGRGALESPSQNVVASVRPTAIYRSSQRPR